MDQRGVWVLGLLLAAGLLHGTNSDAAPLLLRNPSLSQERIAFLYADDVWTVSRQAARRAG